MNPDKLCFDLLCFTDAVVPLPPPQIEGLWQPSVEQVLLNQAHLPNAQQMLRC